MPWPPSSEPPVQAARRSLGSLFNIIQAAQEWGVTRVALASTIGVYGGARDPFEGPLTEDMPLSMSAPHLIPTFKKVSELLGGHLADATGIEVVNLRISGTWGPLGHNPDPFFPAPQLIHAAAHGRAPDLSGVRGRMHAEDSLDLCYVKDTGRAVAAAAARRPPQPPHLQRRLRPRHDQRRGRGRDPARRTRCPGRPPERRRARQAWLDIARLREDTGYEPAWDVERAAADYIDWLRAGNER